MSGYARVSRLGTDADEQRAALRALGADDHRGHLDDGLAGMQRPHPGLTAITTMVAACPRIAAVPRTAMSVPHPNVVPGLPEFP